MHKAGTFGEVYKLAMSSLLTRGFESKPRGQRTKELLGVQLVVNDLRANIIENEIRNMNYRFGVAEWLWIEAGRNDVASILKYNHSVVRYSDDGEIFNGAYGPRLANQWDYIINTLRTKPDTRQAVATIWTPAPAKSKDIPCTVAFQFFVRETPRHGKRLHMVATMRSSDAWLGLPYDFFNFSQIANGIAGELGVKTGGLVMQLGSFHLYEPNWDQAKEALEIGFLTHYSPELPGRPPANLILEQAPVEGVWQLYTNVLHSTKNRAEAMERLTTWK